MLCPYYFVQWYAIANFSLLSGSVYLQRTFIPFLTIYNRTIVAIAGILKIITFYISEPQHETN